MSSNRVVKDEDILADLAGLHQAMTTGFDRVRSEILDVRNDIARLEQRVLRRFDEDDARLGNHETRITVLEGRS